MAMPPAIAESDVRGSHSNVSQTLVEKGAFMKEQIEIEQMKNDEQ